MNKGRAPPHVAKPLCQPLLVGPIYHSPHHLQAFLHLDKGVAGAGRPPSLLAVAMCISYFLIEDVEQTMLNLHHLTGWHR